MLQDTKTTLATLTRLKACGIRIAMDDFGAGYSSLTHLQQFPIDRVKIDRAFTREIAASKKSLAIVKAMTDLCQALEMSTTAEGVETEEQFQAPSPASAVRTRRAICSARRVRPAISPTARAVRRRCAHAGRRRIKVDRSG